MDISTFEVLYRLHGHIDDVQSLSWRPLKSKAVALTNAEESKDEEQQDTEEPANKKRKLEDSNVFLASGSKDKTIRVWKMDKTVKDSQECVSILTLPKPTQGKIKGQAQQERRKSIVVILLIPSLACIEFQST